MERASRPPDGGTLVYHLALDLTLQVQIPAGENIEQVETEDELEKGIRWVTIEGAEYNLEANEILQWLAKYETFISDFEQ